MFNTKEYYKKITKEDLDIKNILKNVLSAFISGGTISIIGQSLIDIYSMVTEKKQAILYMTITVIIIVGILTGIGIYDNIGQICKNGVSIPLSGDAR